MRTVIHRNQRLHPRRIRLADLNQTTHAPPQCSGGTYGHDRIEFASEVRTPSRHLRQQRTLLDLLVLLDLAITDVDDAMGVRGDGKFVRYDNDSIAAVMQLFE